MYIQPNHSRLPEKYPSSYQTKPAPEKDVYLNDDYVYGEEYEDHEDHEDCLH